MSVASWALRILGQRAWKQFESAARDARRAQESLLQRLIDANAESRFGRDHRFARVRVWEDYRRAVPITDYEGFRPYVERIMDGELDALTIDPPYLLTQTSGTTGAPKFIPVTAAQRAVAAAATRVWFYRAVIDHPRLLDGRALAMVSPAIEGYTAGGLPYGSASGHIYQNAPWAIRRVYALPYAVAEIKDYAARYYVAMRLALEQDISFIGTPNPSTIGRLMETADTHGERMITDIRAGLLSTDFDVPDPVRAQITRGLSPNPRRARELQAMAQARGSLRAENYWPHLELVGCWKGGSVGVQLRRLRRWFPESLPFRDIGYLASEADLAIPIDDSGAGGVLLVGSNVYEFIPEETIDDPEPEVLRCDQVTMRETYYVVVTSPNGLYRYDINDIVRVTGFYHQAPIVEFVRKGRDMTSIGGEKLHVLQVTAAVEAAQRESGCSLRHFRAVASAASNRYELLVEAEVASPGSEMLASLLLAVDRHLGQLNIEYAQKRASGRLGAPCLHLMEAGWQQRLYERRLTEGVRDTQFKPTLLSDRFDESDASQIRQTVQLD